MKKAYELGVLCNVDVAVIIFEERPGHHTKLYQYCSSTDIRQIIQRHQRVRFSIPWPLLLLTDLGSTTATRTLVDPATLVLGLLLKGTIMIRPTSMTMI